MTYEELRQKLNPAVHTCEPEYTTFVDDRGRTIYRGKVDSTIYFTNSLEQLREYIKNHVPNTEGTFRDN
jgi:hypothetical protein